MFGPLIIMNLSYCVACEHVTIQKHNQILQDMSARAYNYNC